MKKPTIVITGGSGFVGGSLTTLLQDSYTVLAPSHAELDITDQDAVNNFIVHNEPHAVIHAAAYTDATAAEKDRGNIDGPCYRVNVIGTQHIFATLTKHDVYGVYISTGSVFSGTTENPGPFSEQDTCSSDNALSWYGVTKKQAESYVGGSHSVVRLSHPLYGSIPRIDGIKGDYLHRLIQQYRKKILFPLFTDQYFSITDLVKTASGICTLIDNKKIGIFHMVSTDTVAPHELFTYASDALHLEANQIASTTFDEFIQTTEYKRRFAKYHALSGLATQKKLDLQPYSWKDVVKANMSYYT